MLPIQDHQPWNPKGSHARRVADTASSPGVHLWQPHSRQLHEGREVLARSSGHVEKVGAAVVVMYTSGVHFGGIIGLRVTILDWNPLSPSTAAMPASPNYSPPPPPPHCNDRCASASTMAKRAT